MGEAAGGTEGGHARGRPRSVGRSVTGASFAATSFETVSLGLFTAKNKEGFLIRRGVREGGSQQGSELRGQRRAALNHRFIYFEGPSNCAIPSRVRDRPP